MDRIKKNADCFFFSSRRRHTRFDCDWSSDVCSSDLVVLYLDNCVELATGLFAAMAADGIFVVANAQTKTDKLAYMLNDCRARIMITDRVLEPYYTERSEERRVGKECRSRWSPEH